MRIAVNASDGILPFFCQYFVLCVCIPHCGRYRICYRLGTAAVLPRPVAVSWDWVSMTAWG